MESKPPTKSGMKYNRLTTVRLVAHKRWLCRCECGTEREVSENNLRGGQVKSCGCLRIENARKNIKHGHRRKLVPSPDEYGIWSGIKTRCSNPTVPAYPNYGGRGIKVCERWINSFSNFLSDMGPRPSKAHTVDRYPNPNGDYEPSNCRWVTRKEQASNKRNNVYVEYNNERLTVQQIADRFGRDWSYVYRRLFKYGFSVEIAMKEIAGPIRRVPKRMKQSTC